MAHQLTTRNNRTHNRRNKSKSAPETTTTKYTRYRKDGVYEWGINACERITNRNTKPDIHLDGEFER